MAVLTAFGVRYVSENVPDPYVGFPRAGPLPDWRVEES
jgi:hypothetical protein